MIRRPNKYASMPVRSSRWLPPKGYAAITLWGNILMREPHYTQWQLHKDSVAYKILYQHERIHLCQAVATHNSWLCYYARYFWYYLRGRPWHYGHRAAYFINPFEIEAYLYEADDSYTQGLPKPVWVWKQLALISPAMLHELYKHCQSFGDGHKAQCKFISTIQNYLEQRNKKEGYKK